MHQTYCILSTIILEENNGFIANLKDDRSGNWRVQAVAVSPDRFENRKPLPLSWRGLETYKLSKVTGIPGCVFVHMSGFIGGNRSYEGALAMARASLKA